MCISLYDLFHEASYHSGLYMLFKMHIFIFYNWVVFNCICMPYLPYHLFMGSELSPISRLLWIMLLWTLPLFSRSVVSDSLPPSGLQTLGFPVLHLSPTLLKLMSIELMMPSNYLIFCHLLSSCPQSFPTSGSFPVNQLFTSGGQSIGASTSTSVFPMNIQGLFPLGLTGLITFLSKRFSSVISSTTVWKHQFFNAQPSLWSNSHIHGLPLWLSW